MCFIIMNIDINRFVTGRPRAFHRLYYINISYILHSSIVFGFGFCKKRLAVCRQRKIIINTISLSKRDARNGEFFPQKKQFSTQKICTIGPTEQNKYNYRLQLQYAGARARVCIEIIK